MIPDIDAFIRENTRVSAPSHVPELKLHLADDAVALWEMTEEELGRIGLPPPFWAFAWAGGQALARYVLDNPEIARGKRVLDVASGSGLVAIATLKAGAISALCNDIDAFAAPAANLNAALNDVSVETTDADLIGSEVDADLILIGDAFYERDLGARMLEWMIALEAAGKTVLVGDPGRSYLPKDKLEKLAEYAVPTIRALEDSEVKRTGVWRLKR